MCKNCKSSPLGIERQSELDAAIAECQHLNINPATSGFIARHAWHGHTPQFTEQQRAALTRYNTACSLLKALHNDYVLEQAREAAQRRLERVNTGKHDYLMEYAVAFDANDNAAMTAILKIAEDNSGLETAIMALHSKFDCGRDMCEYLRAMRERR